MKLSLLVVVLASASVACTLGDAADPDHRDGTPARGEASSPSSPAPVGAGSPSQPSQPSEPGAPAGFATAAEQVAAGKAIFSRSCTGCHGSGGQGGRGPRLVGLAQGALSEFDTADDVARFITGNMPVNDAAEGYSVAAWLMGENGVDTQNRVLDPGVAATIRLR